jgi:O-antigen/teichoic acid export membrane protein
MHLRPFTFCGVNLSASASHFRRWGFEISWVFGGQMAAMAGSIVCVRTLTQYLEPATYGHLSLALTGATLVQQVAHGPLSQGAMRYFSIATDGGEAGGYVSAVKVLIAKTSGVVATCSVALAVALVFADHREWIRILIPTMLYAMATGANGIVDGIQNAARQRAVVALHSCAGQWLRIIVVIATVGIFGASAGVVLYAFTAAALIVLASQTLFLARLVSANSWRDKIGEKAWATRITRYSWPFSTWGLFSWAQSAADRWALQVFTNSTDVGLYAVVYQLGYGPIVALSGFSVQLLGPILFQRAGDGTDPTRRSSARRIADQLLTASIAFTIVGTSVAVVLRSFMFKLMVREEFRSVSTLLPLMVLAGGLFATGQIAALSLMSTEKSHRLILPKIGSGALAVVLNVVGVYYYGLHGAVYALVLSSATFCTWLVWLARANTSHNDGSALLVACQKPL